MKKLMAYALIFIFALGFIGCSKTQASCIPAANSDEMIQFHEKAFSKSDLSQETLEWLEWYNALTETEQLSISYIPSDLYALCGYGDAEDIPAETE